MASSSVPATSLAHLTPQQPLSLPELGEDDDLFTEALLSYGEAPDGQGGKGGGGMGFSGGPGNGYQYATQPNVFERAKAYTLANPRKVGGASGVLLLLIIIVAATAGGSKPHSHNNKPGTVTYAVRTPRCVLPARHSAAF